MKIKKLFLVLFAVLLSFPSWRLQAQNIFRSRHGTLSGDAAYFGYSFTAHTKAVEVSLDYETSDIILTLSPKVLHTGVDSIDQLLKQIDYIWALRGTLNLSSINTTTHTPQNFQLTGILELPPNQKLNIKGTGRLEHIGGGEEMACKLSFYFNLDLSSLGIMPPSTGFSGGENLVKVQFFETVLKKVN